MVFLPFLNVDIFPAEQSRSVHTCSRIGHFNLVDAHTALLHHFAGFPLGGEHLGTDGEKIKQRYAALEFGTVDFKSWHTLEHIEQRALVEVAQRVGGLVAEKNLRCGDSRVIVSLAVYHHCEFARQATLHWTRSRVGGMLCGKSLYLFPGEESEYLKVFLRIAVRDIEPELVELIGTGPLRVEPYIAALGLAELSAIGFCDERAGEGIRLAAELATDEFGTGSDVAPLVASAELQTAVA